MKRLLQQQRCWPGQRGFLPAFHRVLHCMLRLRLPGGLRMRERQLSHCCLTAGTGIIPRLCWWSRGAECGPFIKLVQIYSTFIPKICSFFYSPSQKYSGASKLLSNLVKADIIEPVSGYGKGKYKFKK